MLRQVSSRISTVLIILWLLIGTQQRIRPISAQASDDATQEPTPPPTIIVNSTADAAEGCPDTCTLRSAIATAVEGDIIGFDSSVTGKIVLAEPLTIETPLSIVGPGADLLAIDGDKKVRVFVIRSTGVSIAGLTIQNGHTSDTFDAGAGIYNLGVLTLSDSVITDNISQGSGGGIGSFGELTITDSTISNNTATELGGGGIDSNGKLTITNCTIINNTAEQAGGGILITDGNGGETLITNTTIVGNKVSFSGGGLSNGSTGTGGNVTILHSTVVNNEAGFEGGGVYNSSGTLTIGGSIFAGNTDAFKRPDVSGEFTSKGFNLIGDPGEVKGFVKTDQLKVDPLLDELTLNEPGTTQTVALKEGSPAIGKGGTACPESDQRGVKRKSPCDVGAYETGE